MTLDPWFLFPCCFLTLGNALNCSVTQDNGRPAYVISDLPRVSAGDWVYTWANSTGYVIAQNNQETPGLVLGNNISTLITSRCIEEVFYTGTIVSKAERSTARCLVNCTENARSWKTKEFPRHRTAALVVLVLFILSLTLLVFKYFRFRDKIPSCSCRSPLFTAVKKADPDVEAGNE